MAKFLDNLEVGALTKLNALAEQYGLAPYEFAAYANYYGRSPETNQKDETLIIGFEGCERSPDQEAQYQKMLRAIGPDVMKNNGVQGSPKDVIDALDAAIRLAPRARDR